MSSITLIFLLIISARMISNSGVFHYKLNASRGAAIFNYYAENSAQCLRACYEESNCAVVKYHEKNGHCRLYKEGTREISGAYVLSREKTDPTCITEMATSDVTFQKIPRKESGRKPSCRYTRDFTVIQPYNREGNYSFFVTNTAMVADNWRATEITLFFSKKSRENCTAAPVFHKADYRRLYFGEVYNVTGYYFYNAYAFADYCTTQDGECLGNDEIQEYVNDKGCYSYDKPGMETNNMKRSGLGQTFFIANLKR